MVEKIIEISELRSESSELAEELAEFLKEKVTAKIEKTSDAIIVKGESEFPKKHLRVLLRKFLHKAELKDYFRVIAKDENTFIVKKKKVAEE